MISFKKSKQVVLMRTIIEDKVVAIDEKEKDLQAFGLNSSNEGSAIAFKKK
ncbi:hypothetical protein ACEQPO_18495 [Bacillus sp. SL00103]